MIDPNLLIAHVGIHSLAPFSAGEIRARAFEEAAVKLEAMKDKRLPEIFRGCFGEVDSEGWQSLSLTEQATLKGAAAVLRKMANEERNKADVPPC